MLYWGGETRDGFYPDERFMKFVVNDTSDDNPTTRWWKRYIDDMCHMFCNEDNKICKNSGRTYAVSYTHLTLPTKA